MIKKSALLTCCLLLVQITAVGQQPAAAQQPAAQQPAAAQQPTPQVTYETLLEKVKKQDASVDFKALRLAYTETKEYSPYGDDRDARKAMFAALNAKEYDKALEVSQKILATKYVDINAHFVAFAANNRLGQTEKAGYHKYVFENLIRSISDSGDGKTMETAFVVISTDEEYALFNFMGVKSAGQALMTEKDHVYDRMTAIDPKTEQKTVYYFNIDKPFKWLGKSLKQ